MEDYWNSENGSLANRSRKTAKWYLCFVAIDTVYSLAVVVVLASWLLDFLFYRAVLNDCNGQETCIESAVAITNA